MQSAYRVALLGLLIFVGSVGCGEFNDLIINLEGKSKATLSFWARLQGIQYRSNQEMVSLNARNMAAIKAFDIDGAANGFAMLSANFAQAATQLKALDATDVDEAALDYRNRLVAAHDALHEECKTNGAAMASRNQQQLVDRREILMSLLTEYAQLCGEKDAVMSKLTDKFGGDFNCQE